MGFNPAFKGLNCEKELFRCSSMAVAKNFETTLSIDVSHFWVHNCRCVCSKLL